MLSPQEENADELLEQLNCIGEELAQCLSSKQWTQAIAIDRKRMTLLTRLTEVRGSVDPVKYKTLLHQALTFNQAKHAEIQQALDECRVKIGELGQKRRASNLYQDTSLTS